MKPMTPTDRILKIGKKLEKNGLKAFGSTTPGGQPAYFRAHGLQIIPSEADELDTGKTCRLVITSLAANLSGLVTAVIKVLKVLSAGQKRTEGFIEELKTKVFKDMPTSEQWEAAVAMNIVSISLKMVEREFEASPETESDDWSGFDPSTGEITDHQSRYWSRAQEILRNHSGRGRHDLTKPIEARYSMRTQQSSPLLQWVEVLGIIGVDIAGFWIPVVSPAGLAGPRKQAELVKALRRKKLKPDIALTIIANSAKKPKR
jgi:hypothetical protein